KGDQIELHIEALPGVPNRVHAGFIGHHLDRRFSVGTDDMSQDETGDNESDDCEKIKKDRIIRRQVGRIVHKGPSSDPIEQAGSNPRSPTKLNIEMQESASSLVTFQEAR